MSNKVTRVDILTFCKENLVLVHPMKKITDHVYLFNKRGHCPCSTADDNDRMHCPCLLVGKDLAKEGCCKCTFFVTEEYLKINKYDIDAAKERVGITVDGVPTKVQLSWLADIFGITTDRLSHSNQDVFVDHNFRLGYISDMTFYRANATRRTLLRYGIKTMEAEVHDGQEPQYDIIIEFNRDGSVHLLKDNRIAMEADYIKSIN